MAAIRSVSGLWTYLMLLDKKIYSKKLLYNVLCNILCALLIYFIFFPLMLMKCMLLKMYGMFLTFVKKYVEMYILISNVFNKSI